MDDKESVHEKNGSMGEKGVKTANYRGTMKAYLSPLHSISPHRLPLLSLTCYDVKTSCCITTQKHITFCYMAHSYLITIIITVITYLHIHDLCLCSLYVRFSTDQNDSDFGSRPT